MRLKLLTFAIIFIMIFAAGCGRSDHQIDLFFNPAGALSLEKVSFKVKIGNRIIVDTLVENERVDRSLFIKNFHYKPKKNELLHVEINGKKKEVKRMQGFSRCTDVFLRYDDHTLIFDELGKIEKKRSIVLTTAEFRKLFDSIKVASGTRYHEITFNVKEGECDRKTGREGVF